MNLSQFYINGKWVDPVKPEELDVINPATEKSVGRISIGSSQDVDNAVNAARKAFNSFSKTKLISTTDNFSFSDSNCVPSISENNCTCEL